VNEASHSVDQRDSGPWYREPWPWILFGLPAIVVVASLITLWIAVRSDDGVVASDYYKRGLAINAELSRATRAIDLGLRADITLSGLASGDRVSVHLSSTKPLPPEAALRFKLIHPGRSGADRAVMLSRIGGDASGADYVGQFNDEATSTRPVAWQVTLETQAWQLEGQMAPGASMRLHLVATQH
jgi:hypothetical protein